MNIYSQQAKKEKNHYREQISILKDLLSNQGYTNIRFKNVIGTNLDLQQGIDMVILANKNDKEVKVPISLRCRDNWEGRDDFLIRYKASDANGETEIHKLKQGKYKAKYLFYSWHMNNTPQIDWIMVPIHEIERYLNEAEFYNIKTNKDGSSRSLAIEVNAVEIKYTNLNIK